MDEMTIDEMILIGPLEVLQSHNLIDALDALEVPFEIKSNQGHEFEHIGVVGISRDSVSLFIEIAKKDYLEHQELFKKNGFEISFDIPEEE